MRDSVSGLMREYYPSGKLWRVVPFAHVAQGIRHGLLMQYTEAGQLQKQQPFIAGQRQGETLYFDQAGAVKRKITFDHDARTAQQCLMATGEFKDCPDEKIEPYYAGGVANLAKAVSTMVSIPAQEQARHPYGTVLLRFVVGPNAQVLGATVAEAPSPGIGQAVLETFNKTALFTAPGTLNGEPISVLYNLPVRFFSPRQSVGNGIG